ncbi:hypothetical protein HanRHA438_Chr12g0566291 [Helianthus annuus]|nr:hypothetical protein HanXRQr2_Chr12g0554821 [Helianthus annuus]KAJ0867707.1 hypothetical protein HanRHA438_Chr12g0566291 [Helianthus annuus]
MEDLVRFLFFAYKYHHTPHNTSLNNHLSLSSLPNRAPSLSLSLYLQIFKTCSSFKALKVIHGGCKLKGIQRSFVLVLFIIFLTIIFTRISTLALC